VVVENFWTKLPKGTPLRQIWSINRLAYVAVAVFKRYTAPRTKKVCENAHWNFESSIILRRYRTAVICEYFENL